MLEYLKGFAKWIALALVVGAMGALVGSAFHYAVDTVTEIRASKGLIVLLLPVGGLVIAAMYRLCRKKGNLDTNRVIEAVRENKNVPLVMIPLIFVSTVITHLFGGSAGREGAALQLGGGIGYNLGCLFKLNDKDKHIIIMAGMSSVFAALFGTPITAAVFALEVISVGIFHYSGLLACVISSVTAFGISTLLGVEPVRFAVSVTSDADALTALKVVVLGLLCAVLCMAFCFLSDKCAGFLKKIIPNDFVKIAVGGAVIVALTFLVGTYDYNGAGMDVIARAISGQAEYGAFALKLIFTVITISCGFKGGEIVPAFFIGSTFGCVVAPLIGLDASFGAVLGFVALFCGVVNCPIASIFLAVEVFGAQGILYYAIICAVSFMMSGYSGLYKSQKIVYSKLNSDYIDINAK